MRYFIELRYDGAAYCGWQRQPDMPTVQQTIEDALTKLLRTPTEIVGAGRTDTGVNASYYVAHFDSAIEEDCKQLLYKLNMMLPKDIALFSVTPVADDAHARFDARQREYRYYICPTKNPFRRYSAWLYYVPLDVEKMNRAAAKLLEYDDFTSFAKLNSNNKTNICHISCIFSIFSTTDTCFKFNAYFLIDFNHNIFNFLFGQTITRRHEIISTDKE